MPASLKLLLARQGIRVRKQAASLRGSLPHKAPPSAQSKLCIRPRGAPGRLFSLLGFSPRARMPSLTSPDRSPQCPNLLKLFTILLTYCACMHFFFSRNGVHTFQYILKILLQRSKPLLLRVGNHASPVPHSPSV